VRIAVPALALAGLAALAVLVAAAPASASERHPTLAELEGEVVCPTCHTTLDMSTSAVANRIRVFIRERIAAGDTKSEIKSKLVAQFGTAVLAEPPKRGFDLLAWVLPIGGLLLGAAAVGWAAWRWSPRLREPVATGPPLDPELERRLDDELERFDA
jgi:cytochrome c-type biogenesis protein CcmH